jgi:hypothetical protein
MISQERERNIYQLVAIGCFFAFLFVGYKYSNLRSAYTQAEKDKVHYCKEYYKAIGSIETFLDADTTTSNITEDEWVGQNF